MIDLKAKKRLLISAALILLCGIIFSTISCNFLDLPLAQKIHELPIKEWKAQHYTGVVSYVCKKPWITFIVIPFFLWVTFIKLNFEWFRKLGFFLLSMTACGIFSAILKNIFGRARPYMYFRDGSFGFNFFNATKDAFKSFPSGHSLEAATIAACFWFIFPKLRIPLVLFVLLMMTDRMLLERHFLGDTTFGALLAICYVLVIRAYHEDILNERVFTFLSSLPKKVFNKK